VNIGGLGALISSLVTLLFLLFSLAGWRSRRASREARELRQVKELSIRQAEWIYDVRMLAASRGWKLPPVPEEMSTDYLQGKAEGEDNAELAQLVTQIKNLATGKIEDGEKK
jgi:hypothetical protein